MKLRLSVLLLLVSSLVAAQSVHLVVPAFDAAGTAVPVSKAYISWGQFKDNAGIIVQAGQRTVPVTAGVIDVTLTASDSAGYVYTVLLMNGSTPNTFKWRVPAAGANNMTQLSQVAAPDAVAGSALPLIRDDAATVSHVVFDSSGIRDLVGGNRWTSSIAPPLVFGALPASAWGAARTLVGPFSDANYFTQGSAGSSLANFAGAFTACFAFSVTSVSNAPIVFSDYQGTAGHAGWLIQLVNGGGVYLIGQGFAGPLTSNQPKLGDRQIVCAGVSGAGAATGYVQLNGGAVASGAITYNPATTAVARFGGYSTGFALNGSYDEAWFSTDSPSASALSALYRGAMARSGAAGYLFPDSSGTVLHLLGRDFNGATWTAPQAALTTAGTVPSSSVSVPSVAVSRRWGIANAAVATSSLATSAFYFVPPGLSPLDFAGDWSGCVVASPSASDISGTSIYVSNGVSQGTPGWQLVNENGLTRFFGDTGLVTDVTATPGKVNTLCFGKSGTKLYLKVNDRPTVSAPGTITASGGMARIGMHWDFGIGFSGTLYELLFSKTPASDAVFSAAVAGSF